METETYLVPRTTPTLGKRGLAATLIRAFLEPALTESDWREKWKGVNRAAGVVIGWSIAGFLNGAASHAAKTAEDVIAEIESRFNATPAHVQLTDGLRKRVAEILVLMG